MDYRTKYYRPNLAKGTAGAAKTTPTPIRRSATKWAMPVESGGSGGGDRGIIAIMVAGPDQQAAKEITDALKNYLPITTQLKQGTQVTIPSALSAGAQYVVTLSPAATWCIENKNEELEPAGQNYVYTVTVKSDKAIILNAFAVNSENQDDYVGGPFFITGGEK